MNEIAIAKRHLLQLLAVLGLGVLGSYGFDTLAEFRPWRDQWPLATLWQPAEQLYAFAGVGNTEQVTAPSGDLAEDLGRTVAENLVAPEVPTGPALVIDEHEYAGIEVLIEDPTGEGMRPFYEALLNTATEQAEGTTGNRITRVAHYGDSSIATDLITYTMRRNLQQRFGDAGHGFVLPADAYLAYRHRDIDRSANDHWIVREIVRSHNPDGHYGFGGVQIRTRPESWTRIGTARDTPVGTSVGRFEVWYQAYPHGGNLFYEVDGGPRQVLQTRSDATEDRVHEIELPDGPHRLEIKFGGRGQSRLYGVVMERDVPGVIYDSLGMVGARAPRLLNFDATHIAEQIRRRGTDLLILGFGGNEADDSIQRESYERDYAQVIERMRAGREDLGCLIFAPLDQARKDRFGHIATMRTVPIIIEAQRAAARQKRCAFFNTWKAMGGEGAMARWRRSRPRLAMSDLRHATPAGYEAIANLFYKAILQGFAEWLEAQAAASERNP